MNWEDLLGKAYKSWAPRYVFKVRLKSGLEEGEMRIETWEEMLKEVVTACATRIGGYPNTAPTLMQESRSLQVH